MKTVLIQISDADYAKLHASHGPTTVTALSVVGRAEAQAPSHVLRPKEGEQAPSR